MLFNILHGDSNSYFSLRTNCNMLWNDCIALFSNFLIIFVTVSLGEKVAQAEEKEKKLKIIIKNTKKDLAQAKEQVLFKI